MSRPTTIKIFLVDGDPDGLRVVEKSNWNGQAVVVSRTQYPAVRKRAEFGQSGVYVLTAPPGEEGAKPRIYIGEADELGPRLNNHIQTRDFWTQVVAFTGKDRNLNKAHYKFLESRLVGLAMQANTWTVENSNIPTEPNLSTSDIADAEGYLDEMLIIYPILGISAFEVPKAPAFDARIYHLSGEAAVGRGVDEPEGFLVLEGALARVAETASFKGTISAFRGELVADGTLTAEGESYRLTQDYRFGSPSTAASVLLGRNANGRTEWKTEDGVSLKEIQDAAVT